MNPRTYYELRREARKVPDEGGYSLQDAEMNPGIIRMVVAKVVDEDLLRKMWEPFGKPPHADVGDVERLSYGLMSGCDVIADATSSAPNEEFGCVVFHPPYFGSAPQSESGADLSLVGEWVDYCDAVARAMKNVWKVLARRGFVAAVGRDYRAGCRRVRLDMVYLDAMDGMMDLEEVWVSEPDVVLIARKI